jgi:hypothetical protein
VSKLCCPICWELLDILGDERPSLRGSHSTIYPVELPGWIPPEIVEELEKRLQKHLHDEIEIMLSGVAEQPATIRRNRHATHESESNISIASSAHSTHDFEDDD